MAMINDKGPEESRDTDATYIILSHQSVHLPGPSRQEAGKVGGAGRGAGWGWDVGGGRYLLSQRNCLLARKRERGKGGQKRKTSDKEVRR